jgi:hypothetical protein
MVIPFSIGVNLFFPPEYLQNFALADSSKTFLLFQLHIHDQLNQGVASLLSKIVLLLWGTSYQ